MGIYLLMIVIFGASALVSARFKSKFSKYSQVPLSRGLTGKEVAELMLSNHGLHDVMVVSAPGQLSDHYNPSTKTVNLSPEVYSGHSVAAAAVAAHECGHAIQHAEAYAFLQLRSSLVPVISITSRFQMWVILLGVVLLQSFPPIFWAGIAMLALSSLFSFVTLPVEFDASRRAMAWLEGTGIVSGQTYGYSRDALKWAALTYVVAALGSLATLLYYLGFANNND
ncbi:MAG: zinc metallopeptidase [Bacteroidales bacterium]|nr:zinc metallopeptidase [Bacteroidales bacterium]